MSDVIELPVPGRNRTRAALLLTFIVLASGVVGAAVDRLLLLPRVTASAATAASAQANTRNFPSLTSALRSPTVEERRTRRRELSHELGLSAGQERALNEIMDRKSGEFDRLRNEMRPRVELLVSQVRSEIDQVLTPAQQERFHQLQARESQETASRLGQTKAK